MDRHNAIDNVQLQLIKKLVNPGSCLWRDTSHSRVRCPVLFDNSFFGLLNPTLLFCKTYGRIDKDRQFVP